MSFSFGKKWKGQIGIAFHDGGVTIGQSGWKNGTYVQPVAKRIEINPRDFTASDWRAAVNSPFVGSECSIALPASVAHHQVLRLAQHVRRRIKRSGGMGNGRPSRS